MSEERWQKPWSEAINVNDMSCLALPFFPPLLLWFCFFSNFGYFFSEFFVDLLAKSKLKFHKLFQKTYGIIYERNSDVFIDFFRDLEAYYDTGVIDLEDALQRFFSKLYQRMFMVFNSQRNFDYA